MPRMSKELSPLEVRRLVKPGRWSVGGVNGLALQVTSNGGRSWVLRFTPAAADGRWVSAAFRLSPWPRLVKRPASTERLPRKASPDRGASGTQECRFCRTAGAEDFFRSRRAVHRAAREVLEEREAPGLVGVDVAHLCRTFDRQAPRPRCSTDPRHRFAGAHLDDQDGNCHAGPITD